MADVWIDAEQFDEFGGWVLDQQFCHIMGSPYLLAHGLGKPVANARTVVDFPAPGTYRLWVRTRNWRPGPWEPPGRFQVRVNGRAVPAVLGTREGWGWQDAGHVAVDTGRTMVELEDLTGFEGRCDALFFTSDPDRKPPTEPDAMRIWRNRLKGLPAEPPSAGTFDLVIVGGGISGCAAALAADSQGLKVALIHDRPVLGGNASGEIRVHTEGIHGAGADILGRIDTEHWPNGDPGALDDDRKREHHMTASGVAIFREWRAYDVAMDGARIRSVNARHIRSGRPMRFDAPLFIDTTGDGWIGFWAGADHRYGREARDEFDESWDKYGELWSPTRPDNRVMGASLLWTSRRAEAATPFPEVPWAMDVARDHVAVKGEWYWEYTDNDAHQIDDAEEIRDHLLCAIYGSFANAKQTPEFASYELDWVGYLTGKRESRRLMGDHIYTYRDAVQGRRFPDAVAQETRAVDVHHQRNLDKNLNDTGAVDFLSTALFRPVPRYFIPFRSLYSRNVDNLMMAGRCFSCSHIGLGGPRVMLTCGQMGIATGYAAALCSKHRTTPRGIYRNHIEELQDLVGLDTARKPLERTTNGKFAFKTLPAQLAKLHRVTVIRGNTHEPAPAFSFSVNLPVTVYIAVHERGDYTPPAPWEKTAMQLRWDGHVDTVWTRDCNPGTVNIPGHSGQSKPYYGLPHAVFVQVREGSQDALNIGALPEELAGTVVEP